MLRMLARLTGVAGALFAAQALAFGLGEINVQSKLNQRFSASIPLLGATPNQLDNLVVKLASPDAFNRAGIERADYLSSLKFEVQPIPGGARVVVTSDQPAREPFLNFIVEADTADGKMLHEYTVLLDPPQMAQSPAPEAAAPVPAQAQAQAPAPPPPAAAANAAPAPAESAPIVEQAPPPQAAEAAQPAKPGKPGKKTKAHAAAPAAVAQTPASAEPVEGAGTGASTYGPVAPHETLWSVASKLRPGPQVSMDQVLLALYRANPSAFDHGSFNGLIKGRTLQVPSLTDMQETSAADAKAVVDSWRRGSRPAVATASAAVKKNPPEPAPAPAPAAAPEQQPKPAPAKPAAKPSAAVAAVTPPPPAPVPAPAPAPAPAKAPPPAPHTAAPEAHPATTPPPAAPAPSAATPAPAATPPATPATTAPAAAQAKPGEPAPTAAANPPPAAAANPPSVPAPAAEQPPAKKKVVIPPPPPPPGLFEDPTTQIGLAGVLILLIGGAAWYIFRRRKAPPMPDMGAKAPPPKIALGPLKPKAAPVPPPLPPKPMKLGDTTSVPDDHPALAPVEPPRASPAMPPEAPLPRAAMDDTAQLKAKADELALDRSIPRQPPGKGDLDFDLTSQFEAQTVSVNVDANDPLSEADFHLAYGLYDEAASLLKQAVQKEPQRKDLRLKLAETYFAAGKPVDFQETAESLHGELAPAEWQKVAIMGRQLCPDAALFKGEGEAPVQDVDLALGDSIGPVLAAVPTPTAPKPKDQNVIDFDLDSELLKAAPGTAAAGKPSAAPAAKPAAAAASPGAANELDLSNFDLGAEPHPPAGESVEFNLDELDLSKSPGSISSGDEIGTKLDLARVYADMGDNEAARGLLQEVLNTGNPSQKGEAEALIKRLSA